VSSLSNIIKLAVAPDQAHVVAVTEDKCVRVFSIGNDGTLAELSQRVMPKRPCAVAFLPDSSTLIIGDKFGDVYSLPLIATDMPHQPADAEAEEPTPAQVFKPSATNLTVHTQRNRRALESQMKQKLVQPKKEPLAFEQELLLGHVSMLTDAVFATREVDGRQRGCIITADRDEHIRVSRGPPQAHIIEGYCLGHKEFVSNICLIPGTDLLVSGGGDDWLGIWDWPSFTLKAKVNVRTFSLENSEKIAVSGLWSVPCHDKPDESLLCVAVERQPWLLVYSTSALLTGMQARPKLLSTGQKNVLGVSYVDERLVVSVDERGEGQARLLAYQSSTGSANSVSAERDVAFDKLLEQVNSPSGVEEDTKTIDGLLYSTANLRKRGGWDEGQQDEA
jgi:tRNA (guanine-N(7)-)-methyltransferase subunit TRM82